MEIKKLREILRNKRVYGIIYEPIYFQNYQMIKEKSTTRIEGLRFWDIKLNRYLFLHYINSNNKLCKTILLIDFIYEILTDDVSDVKCDFVQNYIGAKIN